MNNSNRRLSSISSSSYRQSSNQLERGKKTNCDICQEKFNLLHREHVCKRCSRSICSNCGKSKKIIAGYEKKPEKEHRICTICKKESDRLDEMRKEFGLQFGCDSKIVPTWLNTMGIQNWPDVEQNFKKMIVLTKEQQNSPAYKLMTASMNMQSYNSNFQGNYSFIEMLYFSQQEVQGKVHQTIKDTLTAFIGQYHDTIGFSDDLLNTTVFLLCFSSPPKAFCLLESIYSGKIIPKHLFPVLDEEFSVSGNPLKKQCNEQILKILKDKFKCDNNTIAKYQKFIEDIGSNYIESLMIAKANFETCYSLFDTLLTIQSSKYTHLIKFITTFLYINKDTIITKNIDNPFDLQKEILDKTQKDELLVQMKWNLAELPIPIYQDKVKDLQKVNQILIQEKEQHEVSLQNLTQENDQLKKKNSTLSQELEAYGKYMKTKEGQLQEQIELEKKNLKEQEEKYKKEKEDYMKQNEAKKSQMESSIIALQQKNNQLESEKDELNTKVKGLEIDLQQTKNKNVDEIANLKKLLAEEQTISSQKRENFEKIIDQLNSDISVIRDSSKKLENDIVKLQVELENKDKDLIELKQKHEDTIKNREQQLNEISSKNEVEMKKLEQIKTESEQKCNELTLQITNANKEIEELKENLHRVEGENDNFKRENEDWKKKSSSLEDLIQEKTQRQAQELKDKSEIFNQSIKEIARVKGELSVLSEENKTLKQTLTTIEAKKKEFETENEKLKQENQIQSEKIKNLEKSESEKSDLLLNLQISLKQKDDVIENLSNEIDSQEANQIEMQDINKEKHNQELNEKNESIKSLEDQITSLKSQIEENKQNTTNLNNQIHKKDQDLDQLNKDIEKLKHQIEEINTKNKQTIKEKDESQTILSQQLLDLQSKLKLQEEDSAKELEELQNSFSKLREELQNLQTSLEESEQNHAVEKQQMEQKEIDQEVLITECEKKIKDQNQELTTTTAQLKKLKEENQRKEDSIQEKEKRIKQISERLNENQTELKKTVLLLDQTKQDLEINEKRAIDAEEQLKTLQNEINQKEESLVSLNKTVQDYQTTIENQENDIKNFKRQIEDQTETIEQLESTKEEIHSQISDLNEDIKNKQSELHSTIEKLQKQCDFKDSQYNQLKEEMTNLLDSNNQDTNVALHEKEDRLKKLEQSLFDIQSALQDKEQECEKLNTQLNTIQANQKKTKEDLVISQNELAAVKKTLQIKEVEITNKQSEVNKLLRESQDSVENKNSIKEQFNKDISNLNQQITLKDKEINNLKASIKTLNNEILESKDQLSNLQSILEESEIAKNEANRSSISMNAQIDEIESANLIKQKELESQISVLNEKIKKLELKHKEEMNTLNKDNHDLKLKLDNLEDVSKQKQNDNSTKLLTYQKQIEELTSQINKKEVKQGESQNQFIQLQDEYNKIQLEMTQLTTQLKDQEITLQNLQNEIKQKDEQIENLVHGEKSSKQIQEEKSLQKDSDIVNLQKQHNEQQEKINHLNKEKAQLGDQIIELEQKLQKLTHKQEKLQKANEQFVSQLVDKENEYESLHQKIISLNQLIQQKDESYKQIKEEHEQYSKKIKTLESKGIKDNQQSSSSSSSSKNQPLNPAKEKELLSKIEEQVGIIKQYQNQLNKYTELEERIQLKNEENLILQQMIRSMTQNTPKQDSISVIAFDKIKAENIDLTKKNEQLMSNYKTMSLRYIAKFMKANTLNKLCQEQTQKQESLNSKINKFEEENQTYIKENSRLQFENTQNKTLIQEKDSMLQQLQDRHQKQVVMLTEENGELIVSHKKLQNQLSITSNELKVSYMKILLMSLEYERLIENHSSQDNNKK